MSLARSAKQSTVAGPSGLAVSTTSRLRGFNRHLRAAPGQAVIGR